MKKLNKIKYAIFLLIVVIMGTISCFTFAMIYKKACQQTVGISLEEKQIQKNIVSIYTNDKTYKLNNIPVPEIENKLISEQQLNKARDYFCGILILCVVIVFCLAAGCILFYKYYKDSSQKDKIYKKNLDKAVKDAILANEAKSEFMARMSHDMRTPMNGILGLASLSEDENDIEILHSNMEKIKISGQYLLGLINDTLDIQKIKGGNLKLCLAPVYGERLFTEVESLTKELLKNKNIELKVDISQSNLNCYVYMDLMRSKQIIVNLISNAIKFTPDGGVVLLSYRCIEKDDTNIKEEIIVEDSGIGMSKEFIKNHIFKPFSQENSRDMNNNTGTGLGLAISKQLVELMNGTITVKSNIGEGTIFKINISYDLADKEALDKEEEVNKKNKIHILDSLNGKRILLAEDHPLNAEIAIKLLTKQGCIVTWAHDGRECVDIFANSKSHQFSAILMDIRMPNLDGNEATKEIRSINRKDAKQIPIIAMTANAFDEDRKQSMEAGMNAHLAKPIDPTVLYQVLSENIEPSR